MSLKFCANLSFLFTENTPTILEKFRLASKAGFKAVEHACPSKSEASIEQMANVQKETGLEVALINISSGVVPNGGFGCASFPDMHNEFKENLDTTIKYANALNCKKYNT